MSEPQEPSPAAPASPKWTMEARLVAAVAMILGFSALLIRLRQLILPILFAFMLAYVLYPIVVRLAALRLPRWGAVLIVYLALILLISGATTGVGLAITQQLSGLVQNLGALSNRLPAILDSLAQSTIVLGPWSIDLARVNLEPLISTITSGIQPVLSQTGALLASILSATASTLGMLLLVLVLGYYILRDFDKMGDAFLNLVPAPYRPDFRRLLIGTGQVWQSFLRGQLLLGLVVGVATSVLYAAVGLRFALGLGLIAGVLEFIPVFGPVISGTVAVLVALFQGSNAWGWAPVSFAALVLGVAIVIQQVENNVLVPRIIGHSLNLHPLIVLVAALSGGALAGVPGVLLAAPVVATGRLWLGYTYRKTVGLETWPAEPPEEPSRRRSFDLWERFVRALRRRKAPEVGEARKGEREA